MATPTSSSDARVGLFTRTPSLATNLGLLMSSVWRVGPGGDAVNMDRVCRLVARSTPENSGTWYVEAVISPSPLYWVVLARDFPSEEAAKEWIEREIYTL